jgi:putative membrane protein
MKGLHGILRSRTAGVSLAAGILLFAAVIAWQGVGDVVKVLGGAGWGLFVIALFHLPPLWADAMGWRSLVTASQRPSWRVMLRYRWIGESINDLLPVLQMGGNIVKAWLLVGRGVEIGRAGASVVIDITLIVLTQIIFTVFGLCLAASFLGSKGAIPVVLAGAGVIAILLSGFYVAQRRGLFGFVVAISKRFLGSPEWASASRGAAMIDTDVMRLYKDRRTLAVSGCWHMAAWLLGVFEIWFALRILGHPVDIGTAFLFESLGQAIRTGAFAVPGGLGIQEGGYVVVGSVLGINPAVALALSLARRVRELLFGLPGLVVWQGSAIGRIFRRKPDEETIPAADEDSAKPDKP